MSKLAFDKNVPIIIVDDDPMAIFLTKEILLDYDHELQLLHYTDSQKFLADANKLNPSALILLDLNMPRMNGWELAEELKKAPFPIVVLTSSFNQEDCSRAMRSGMGFLQKPLQIEEFENQVKELMAERDEGD